MSRFTLAGGERLLLSHMALFGLASILETARLDGLTVSWRGPHAALDAPQLDPEVVGEAVRTHADAHTDTDSWVQRDLDIDGNRRGLMSPRLAGFKGADTWRSVQQSRHAVLDGLTERNAWSDLRMLAALGEPCYWSHNTKGEPLQDDGASRLEMQPRNRGSEIVTNRLRPLAAAVARRSPDRVAAGLDGSNPIDELGKDRPESVTATGLSVPGPVDNALAWCALWGIASLPLGPRIDATAVTSGHLGRSRREWFYVPVWSQPWRPARLRTVLASAQLRTAGGTGLGPWSHGAARELSARTWLRARGVIGVVRFDIERFGSDNAPERRALEGEALSLRAEP